SALATYIESSFDASTSHLMTIQPDPRPADPRDASISETVRLTLTRDYPATVAAAAAALPLRDGSRFRVRQFHAQGGLGVVSVAEDLELQRWVAYKQIQPKH